MKCLNCEHAEAESDDIFCGGDCEHDYLVSISEAVLERRFPAALAIARARIDAFKTLDTNSSTTEDPS